ncbi:putative uncharacterized protein [Paraprevotella clara CAG:116]|nr:putative uncharacterized protein [Paraprevotella clara CAG:116]
MGFPYSSRCSKSAILPSVLNKVAFLFEALTGAIKPLQFILGLFAGVWCGASCFRHLDVMRYDTVLCNLFGWRRGADYRVYQRYFDKL